MSDERSVVWIDGSGFRDRDLRSIGPGLTNPLVDAFRKARNGKTQYQNYESPCAQPLGPARRALV